MANVLKPLANKLDVIVAHGKGKGRIQSITDITIKFNGDVIANKVLGGKYTQEQAMTEFKRNHSKWTISNQSSYDNAKLLKLF